MSPTPILFLFLGVCISSRDCQICDSNTSNCKEGHSRKHIRKCLFQGQQRSELSVKWPENKKEEKKKSLASIANLAAVRTV
jgi:alkylhydroperoxidase/carboxymuconolactone decarboxylase family protein YurZ